MFKLNGQQESFLEQALIDAFPTKDELRRMLQYRLSRNLEAIAMGDSLSIIAFKLIQAAKAQGWLHTLIARAREENPTNPTLVSFCQQIELSPSGPEDDTLERIISPYKLFLDVNIWREKLGKLENQICRVEVPLSDGTISFGTGFLVQSNLLLTNFHVMEDAIVRENLKKANKPWANPENVILRFDYKTLSGNIVNPGKEYSLATDWLIDYSPMSKWDSVKPPKGGDPNLDELDFAVLRVKGNPGNDPIGVNPSKESPKRGWINIPAEEYVFLTNSTLLILQHPKTKPLKLAFDTNANLILNNNKTRVTYRTNTEPGSSGSPCFSPDWKLVALHHAGDPDYSPAHHPEYNQGIPIKAINDLLEKHGNKKLITG